MSLLKKGRLRQTGQTDQNVKYLGACKLAEFELIALST